MEPAVAHFDKLAAEFAELDFVVSRPAPHELVAYRNGTSMRAIVHIFDHQPFKVYDLISVVLPMHDDFNVEEIFKDNISRTSYFSSQGVLIPNSIVTKMVYGFDMLVNDTANLAAKVDASLKERDK